MIVFGDFSFFVDLDNDGIYVSIKVISQLNVDAFSDTEKLLSDTAYVCVTVYFRILLLT